jgi:RNA polymerase subunit RPABC4/transcription elongation factor Spt4
MSSQDPLWQLKKATLKRLNSEYRLENNILRKVNITISSMNSLQTRDKYIERLQERIKLLEENANKVNANNKSRGSIDQVVKSSNSTTDSPKDVNIFGWFSKKSEGINQKKKVVEQEKGVDSNKCQSAQQQVFNISEKDPDMQLKACKNCKRKFRLERIEIHQNSCIKQKPKRVQFDGEKMRKKGTDLENYKMNPKTEPKKPKATSSSNDMKQCLHCKRYFGEKQISNHLPICQRLSAAPKREVFRTKPKLSIF